MKVLEGITAKINDTQKGKLVSSRYQKCEMN